MEFFFKPKGIAVVGASPGKGKGGNLIISNLKKGYSGGIYPVNPRYPEIEGLTCYPSVLDVPEPADLAIVFVSARMVSHVIGECVKRKIPGAMIQSAGFSEIGEQGKEFQNETLHIARQAGMRLWGPNCMGLVDIKSRFVFSTVTPSLWDTGLPAGDVSLIVQSGMLSGAFLIDVMSHGITGISKVCSIGNKMDVNENDLLEYLEDDPETGVIGFYLESFADSRRFIDLSRRSAKPVVMLNGGKTAKGAAAAMSHTASMSANGAIVSGVLAQAGVAEAAEFYQMTDFCRTLAMYPKPQTESQNRVAVITYSGGAGIVSADLMDKHGLIPAKLAPATLKELESVFPDWMPPSNPIDMWPGIILNGVKKAYRKAMEAVGNDPDVDAIFVHCFVGGFDLEPDLLQMAEMAKKSQKPLFCWISGEREEVYAFQKSAQKIGVPVFREIIRAIECMAIVLNREPKKETEEIASAQVAANRLEPDSPVQMLATETGNLDEYDSKRILSEFGIPVADEKIALSKAEAVAAAQSFGFPLVAKGLLPSAPHKTESNLVRLNITSQTGVEAAFEDIERTMQGKGRVLIQKQVEGKIELTAGFVRDAEFGPCVMCGLGGIFTEALNETVFGMAPLTRSEALNMLNQLKCQDVLNGFRGFPAVDREALVSILVALGNLGYEYPRIGEIDINPLIIHKGLPVAVDALLVLSG